MADQSASKPLATAGPTGIPPEPPSLLKKLGWRVRDLHDARAGKLLPPRRLRHFADAGDYESIGQAYLAHCVDLASLEASDRVLDVGCGIGRLAVPLSGYLEPSASYLGVDTWAEGIAWCRRHVGARYPNFTFTLLDVYDEKYNPTAPPADDTPMIDASPGSFDFATLISILHLRPEGVRRYLSELARVLRPGGRYLGSWYLLAEEDDRPSESLPRPAMTESAARAMLDEAGIDVAAVYPGWWDGRTDGLSLQDVIVGQRRA